MNNDETMLTNKDLLAIGKIVDTKIIAALSDFFEQILAPYFDEHIEKKLDEHDKRFDNIEKRLYSIEIKTDKIAGKIDGHDEILADHGRQLEKLGKQPISA